MSRRTGLTQKVNDFLGRCGLDRHRRPETEALRLRATEPPKLTRLQIDGGMVKQVDDAADRASQLEAQLPTESTLYECAQRSRRATNQAYSFSPDSRWENACLRFSAPAWPICNGLIWLGPDRHDREGPRLSNYTQRGVTREGKIIVVVRLLEDATLGADWPVSSVHTRYTKSLEGMSMFLSMYILRYEKG